MDKIYIIEDDENIRNLLKIALEGFGYEAQGFETAEEGLEQIAKEPPALVIFDWMLPGMDGFDVLRGLATETGPLVPVLLLTARGEEVDRVIAPYDGVVIGYWTYSVCPPHGWVYMVGKPVEA